MFGFYGDPNGDPLEGRMFGGGMAHDRQQLQTFSSGWARMSSSMSISMQTENGLANETSEKTVRKASM